MADEGHLVGSHTFYHARMPLLTTEGFEEDLREAERAILETTGVDPQPWLRFPFGAGADDAGIVGSAAGARLSPCRLGRGAVRVGARAVGGRDRRAGGRRASTRVGTARSSCCHTWPDPVAPSLAEIVERLRDRGARFVGVDELDLPDDLSPIGTPRPAVAAATA